MLSVAVFTRLAPSVALITRKMRGTAACREIFIVITCCGNQITRDMQTELGGAATVARERENVSGTRSRYSRGIQSTGKLHNGKNS